MPRIDVAVARRDGELVEVVNAGRPAALVAFGDEHGHDEPQTYRETAWLVWKATRVDEPFDEWLETLDELDPRPRAVRRARRAIAEGLGWDDPALDEAEQAERDGEVAARLAELGADTKPADHPLDRLEQAARENAGGEPVLDRAAIDARVDELAPVTSPRPDPTPPPTPTTRTPAVPGGSGAGG